MGKLFEPFTPINFGDLFTLMWVGAFVILAGSIVVYNAAGRAYRRYPAILALHEWIFWSIFAPWLVVPLLVVIHVPLALLLLLVVPGIAVAIYAAFIKFPPIIEAVKSRATLGEVSDALRVVFGEHRELITV